MKAIVPGHVYALDHLDAEIPTVEWLHFVKRVGEKFPGNHPPATSGCISQDVIRVLIDRTEYVNGQRDHWRNQLVLIHLREALRELEMRAAEEREAEPAAMFRIQIAAKPELMPVCAGCGHVQCNRSHDL